MFSIHVDFSACQGIDDLYDVLRGPLDLPAFFGNNLDALWDALTGMVETPFVIEFHGTQRLPKALRVYAARVIEVFRDARDQYGKIEVRVQS